MAAIILPRKHYTQPQGRVEIAPEWADKMRVGVNFGSSVANLVGDPFFSREGNTIYPYATAGGIGFFSNTGTIQYGIRENNQEIVNNTPFAVILVFVPRSASNYNFQFGNSRSTTVPYVGIANNRQVYFGEAYRLTLPEYKIGVVNSLILQHDGLVFSAVSSVNGVIQKTTASGVSYQERGFAWFNDFFSSANEATTLAGAVWIGRSFTDEAAIDLVQNPWQLFKAEPTRIYSLPPVLTIPTLSNPGVIDITATSARPQVTLAY